MGSEGRLARVCTSAKQKTCVASVEKSHKCLEASSWDGVSEVSGGSTLETGTSLVQVAAVGEGA